MSYNWNCFLQSADEWLITYALPPQRFIFVKLFAIGHVVELHLKASYAKLSGSVDEAICLGHNIPGLWNACKADTSFMPGFELRQSVLNAEILNTDAVSQQLSADDRDHLFANMEFYVIAKYLADLKYLGAPLKKIDKAYAIGGNFPNIYWIRFLKELRAFLDTPTKERVDFVDEYLKEGILPVDAATYLQQLFT
ncbi:MAG TPA: hypothetical protein VGD61_23835 [Pyrinomonadaceae bacterium]